MERDTEYSAVEAEQKAIVLLREGMKGDIAHRLDIYSLVLFTAMKGGGIDAVLRSALGSWYAGAFAGYEIDEIKKWYFQHGWKETDDEDILYKEVKERRYLVNVLTGDYTEEYINR